ncbi:phosphatase and actin regulator 2 [Trichonephila clavipes]|nr:phosphatase and actin regulator 2 [Trichonephila clavipes]
MKTSSVEFISRSPTPSPMERNYRRFVLLRRIFEPWQWKRRKKRNRFEQTSRTLQRKISMRSTKDQLVKKDVLMPVKQCFPVEPSGCRRVLVCSVFFLCFRFSSGLHGSTAADSVRSEWPLWHAAKSKAVFARRRSKSKRKLLDIRAELEREERTREVREQALPSEYHQRAFAGRRGAGIRHTPESKNYTIKNLIESSEIFETDKEFLQSVIDGVLAEKAAKIEQEKSKLESERAAKIEQEKFKLESEKAKIEFEKIKLEQLKKELS